MIGESVYGISLQKTRLKEVGEEITKRREVKADCSIQTQLKRKLTQERDQDILRKREGGLTLREVGKQYGLCYERIRQIEQGLGK